MDGAPRHNSMAKKKKLASKAPVPLTRGQLSRRAREQRRIRNLYTVAVAVGTVVVLVLGWAVVNTYLLRPNAEVAKVGDVTINRDAYNKFRRYNLYQQIQNAALMQGLDLQGSSVQPSNIADLQRAMQNVDNETTFDADTVNQMVDNELLRQGSVRDFGLNPSKEEMRTYAYKDFLPSPTPLPTDTPLPVTPSSTVVGTATATGTLPTSTPTQTATPGSPTVTPTPSATLPPVPGAQETAVALYNRYSAAMGGKVAPSASDPFCEYGCPNVSEDDFLKIAFEARYRREQVIEKLVASSPISEAVQIRVQHILTDTEEHAKNIVAELDKGTDFTKLANEQSSEQIDRVKQGLTPNGGVIEWFAEEGSNLVEPFVKCAFATEVGKYSQPCKTDFGYHVIKVLEKDEKRPRDASQIETVKNARYDAWFKKIKDEYTAAGRIRKAIPEAPVIPTQPPIVDPTSPPVQQPTPGGTPPNPDAITGTNSLTSTTAPAANTPNSDSAPPGTGTTPTAGPDN
jgi:parvulin-like peptidyl-prolyl isomerase